jgi:hypothetical protein
MFNFIKYTRGSREGTMTFGKIAFTNKLTSEKFVIHETGHAFDIYSGNIYINLML